VRCWRLSVKINPSAGPMMLSIRYRFLSPPPSLDQAIEDLVVPLGEHRRLDEVQVVVEERTESSPPFKARIDVVVPGPDVLVEIADHTPENACRRAVEEIDRRLRGRVENRRRQRPRGRKHPQNFRMGRRSR